MKQKMDIVGLVAMIVYGGLTAGVATFQGSLVWRYLLAVLAFACFVRAARGLVRPAARGRRGA